MPDAARSTDQDVPETSDGKLPETHGSAPTLGEESPVLLFDGVCHLCAHSVRFVLQREVDEALHFAPLQSAVAQKLLARHGLPADFLDGLVLIDRGTVHTKSSAALRVAARLRFPWKLCVLFLVVPKPLRDAVYGLVARYRYRWFGKDDACMVPDPRWKDRFHD